MEGHPSGSGSVPLLGDEAGEALERALMKHGVLCPACGKATYWQTGAPADDPASDEVASTCWEFLQIHTGIDDNGPFLRTHVTRVCKRPECHGAKDLDEDPGTVARRSVPAFMQIVLEEIVLEDEDA